MKNREIENCIDNALKSVFAEGTARVFHDSDSNIFKIHFDELKVTAKEGYTFLNIIKHFLTGNEIQIGFVHSPV